MASLSRVIHGRKFNVSHSIARFIGSSKRPVVNSKQKHMLTEFRWYLGSSTLKFLKKDINLYLIIAINFIIVIKLSWSKVR